MMTRTKHGIGVEDDTREKVRQAGCVFFSASGRIGCIPVFPPNKRDFLVPGASETYV